MSSEIVALANTPLLLVAALLVGAIESTAHGLTCESSPGAAARQTTARRTLAPHQFYPAGPCLCAGASPRLRPYLARRVYPIESISIHPQSR
jgi:hypothetical protein